jgi:hypothetical protein
VAETLELRRRLTRRVLIDFLWQQAALVAVIGLVFFLWGVKSGWRTPSIVAERSQAHTHPDDLQIPPDEDDVEKMTGHR